MYENMCALDFGRSIFSNYLDYIVEIVELRKLKLC